MKKLTAILFFVILCCSLFFVSCDEKDAVDQETSISEEQTRQADLCAAGHSVVTDAATPATCTEGGKTEGTHCSVCHEILVAQSEIDAFG